MARRTSGILFALLSLLLVASPAVGAQTSALVPGAITVAGEGMASAPAETATVVITLGADSNVYYEPMPADTEITAVATPAVIDESWVIQAMVAFGIPAENIMVAETTFQGEWGSGMPPQPVTLLVTVNQPTVDGLSDLLEVVRASANESALFVNSFGVMYNVADCRPLRQQARVNAVANAREQADDQAAALGTTAGPVVASRDTMPTSMGFFQMNSCNTAPMAVPYSVKYSVASFDPTLPAEVTVSVAVEVSFQLP